MARPEGAEKGTWAEIQGPGEVERVWRPEWGSPRPLGDGFPVELGWKQNKGTHRVQRDQKALDPIKEILSAGPGF